MFLLDLFNNKSITLTDPNQTKIRKNLYEVGVGSKALDYGIKGKPTNLNPDTPFGIYSLDAGPLLGKQVTFEILYLYMKILQVVLMVILGDPK